MPRQSVTSLRYLQLTQAVSEKQAGVRGGDRSCTTDGSKSLGFVWRRRQLPECNAAFAGGVVLRLGLGSRENECFTADVLLLTFF